MEAHFLRTHAAEAVRAVTAAMVSGNVPGKNLAPPLLTLLRREVENQQRFPMQLVQDLCRALESQGLRFFKRDKKTTCVCKNRPHYLPDDLVLSERVRSLVEMVRANPGITYSRLVSTLAPHIESAAASPAPAPSAKAMVEAAGEEAATLPDAVMEEEAPAAVGAAEVSPAVEAEAAPATEMSPDISAPAGAVPDAADSPDASAETETAAGTAASDTSAAGPDISAATESAPAADAPPAPAPPPAPHLSPGEIAILQDLHWLVQEGFVTEFQSGELFVLGRPPLPPVERKPRGPRPPRTDANEELPAAAGAGGEGEAVVENAPGPIATEAVIAAEPVPSAAPEEPLTS